MVNPFDITLKNILLKNNFILLKLYTNQKVLITN